MIEQYFDCPHCWENQLKLIDTSITNQSFIEDCETCCNPLEFHINVRNNVIASFTWSGFLGFFKAGNPF